MRTYIVSQQTVNPFNSTLSLAYTKHILYRFFVTVTFHPVVQLSKKGKPGRAPSGA